MSPRRRPGDHVIILAEGVSKVQPRAHALCQHCGERFLIQFPQRIETFVEVGRGFVRAHVRCPRPETLVAA